MSRPARATVDLAAIRHNYRYAKQLVPGSRALAVIKANAYGHGAIAVARALSRDADAFGVACIEEALELRESGIERPIVLLEGVFAPDELALADALGLVPVVHSEVQLEWLLQACPRSSIPIWLKMDSGMHRIGLDPSAYRSAYSAAAACPHVGKITLMSHLARADELDSEATDLQLACFATHTAGIRAPRSLANSAAVLAWPAAHGDWLRPGLMLYGATPIAAPLPAAAPLRPSMRLETALISIRDLAAGEAIGYGGRFVCERATKVGVAALGYADGYPRHAVDGTPVSVDGQPTRLIGRVSMDMLTVDLTGLPHARIGSRVQLWGDELPVNAVAAASDTIAYQLFTGVSQRVPVSYSDTE